MPAPIASVIPGCYICSPTSNRQGTPVKSPTIRQLAKSEKPLVLPGAHDALSALLIKEAGFKGSRYFQIVAPDMGHISQVRIVDALPVTQRGVGGFGSTG